MTEEARPREPVNPTELFGPPFYGVGFGEKLGSFEARLVHVEHDISEVKGDIKILNAKVDNLSTKVEVVVQAVSHLDARMTAQETGFNEKFAGLDARLTAQEIRFNEKFAGLDARLTAQEAGFNEKFAGLNEKFTDLKKTVSDNSKALWGMFIALMAAIIVQKFI